MTILFSVAFFHSGWLQAIELQADRLGFFNRILQRTIFCCFPWIPMTTYYRWCWQLPITYLKTLILVYLTNYCWCVQVVHITKIGTSPAGPERCLSHLYLALFAECWYTDCAERTGLIHQQDPGGEADERRRRHSITSAHYCGDHFGNHHRTAPKEVAAT